MITREQTEHLVDVLKAYRDSLDFTVSKSTDLHEHQILGDVGALIDELTDSLEPLL